jgi:hypothetical protein
VKKIQLLSKKTLNNHEKKSYLPQLMLQDLVSQTAKVQQRQKNKKKNLKVYILVE